VQASFHWSLCVCSLDNMLGNALLIVNARLQRVVLPESAHRRRERCESVEGPGEARVKT
jgi:hypothetical protein